MIVLHHYDKDTGIYIGSSEAPPRPAGVGLPANCTLDAPPVDIPDGECTRWTGSAWEVIPIAQSATAYGYDADGISSGPVPAGQTVERSTDVAPPAAGSGMVAIWNGTTWNLEEDHRGETVYYTSNAGAHIVTALGPVPEGCTTLVPPDYAVWQDGTWGQDVAQVKAAARSRINTKAEMLCTTLVTPGITQQTRYARKLAQAEAYLQATTPTQEDCPLIYNEVGITASNAGAVAWTIVQAAKAFDSFCDTVECVRMRGKEEINAASNASLVASAEAAIVWPST